MNTATARNPLEPVAVTLRVDGCQRPLILDSRASLLDALREHLGLTATDKACDRADCGECTVLVDGRRIYSCLALAVSQEGCHISTIGDRSADAAAMRADDDDAEHTPGTLWRCVATSNVRDAVRAFASADEES